MEYSLTFYHDTILKTMNIVLILILMEYSLTVFQIIEVKEGKS